MITVETLFGYILLVVGGLLPLANPFSTAPVYLSLTQHLPVKEQRRQANLACIYMAIILLVFLFFGALIIAFFGITIPGVRIAGGLVVMYLGFVMLFPQETQLPDQVLSGKKKETDFAFTPLAMPLLSGPGSIAVILGFSTQIGQLPETSQKVWGFAIATIGIVITTVICWLVLSAARTIIPWLGAARIDAMTRMFGFLLICIGVQFALNGVKAFIVEL